MKNEELYNEWTKFIQENPTLFTNQLTSETSSVSPVTDITDVPDITEVVALDSEEEMIVPVKSKKSTALKKKTTNKTPTDEQPKQPEQSKHPKQPRYNSAISQLHKQYKTMTSANLNAFFKTNPEKWHEYHRIAESNDATFHEEDIPRNRVIAKLNKIVTSRTKKVVDMGCGQAQLSAHFRGDSRFTFYNYDHVSINETVLSADCASLPLPDASVEICVLSMSMWGSNKHEYVKEARRVLETGGTLYVIEPTRRWSEIEFDVIVNGSEGMKLKRLLEEHGFICVEEQINKFCLFVCYKK